MRWYNIISKRMLVRYLFFSPRSSIRCFMQKSPIRLIVANNILLRRPRVRIYIYIYIYMYISTCSYLDVYYNIRAYTWSTEVFRVSNVSIDRKIGAVGWASGEGGGEVKIGVFCWCQCFFRFFFGLQLRLCKFNLDWSSCLVNPFFRLLFSRSNLKTNSPIVFV